MVIMAGLVLMAGLIFLPFFAPNVKVLLAGQVLCDTPWGMVAIMGSSYASEVCPLALRGFLTSFVNISGSLGSSSPLEFCRVLSAIQQHGVSRIPFAIQGVWCVPLFLIALFAPDSPWWLVRKGRLADAEISLARLSPTRHHRKPDLSWP